MFCSSMRFFSCKIILSRTVPSRRKEYDMIQLWVVIISLQVRLVRLSSLCTLSSSLM